MSLVSPELGCCQEELLENEEEVHSLTIPDQFGPLAASVSLSVGLDITECVGVIRVGAVGSGVPFPKMKDTKYVSQ